MSTIINTVDPVPATAPVDHSSAAQALVDQLRAMRGQIPYFTIPETSTDGVRLVRGAAVPAAFVELTAVALKNSPALVRGGGADPEQLRDMQTYATAYSPFADELEALALFVRHSVLAATQRARGEAQRRYRSVHDLRAGQAPRQAPRHGRPPPPCPRHASRSRRRQAQSQSHPGARPVPGPHAGSSSGPTGQLARRAAPGNDDVAAHDPVARRPQ